MRKHIPNILTTSRLFMALWIPFLLASQNSEKQFFAFGIFLLASLTDLLDGILARKWQVESTYGKIMDPLTDKVLILGCMFQFSRLGLYPIWLIWFVFLREALVTATRLRALKNGHVLAAEMSGKIKTNFQITSVILSFFVLLSVSSPSWLHVLNYIVLALTVFITFWSGYEFYLLNDERYSLSEAVSTMGYIGYVPKAPGTLGSFVALFLIALRPDSVIAQVGTLFIWFILATLACDIYHRKVRQADPQQIVADEAIGILVTFLAIPLSPATILMGFVLFRVFDILKPQPIRFFESWPGGWGIVLDDFAAGVFANIILHVLILLPSLV